MSLGFLANISVAGLIWWIAIYLLSNNIRSKIAFVSSAFLASLSIFLIANEVTRNVLNYDIVNFIWHVIDWSYLLPIALLFHFSVLITNGSKMKINKLLLYGVYVTIITLWFLTNRTNLMIDYSTYSYVEETGSFANPRGPLFWLTTPVLLISGIAAAVNYYIALRNSRDKRQKIKFTLAIISSVLYLIAGPFVVILYYDPLQIDAVRYGALLLTAPFLPMIIAIFWYGLISDVDKIFNWKEFIYLTLAIFIINILKGSLFFALVVPRLGELAYVVVPILIILTLTTHSFYDWLSTFIRDLLYNYGKGFSLITDNEVNDIVRNYHNSEKLEATSLARFKSVRKNNVLPTDGIQLVVRDAIEYFKQPDYPRRTKQNIKYQILKMMTLDQAEEGQILWELGFEGYPMKIMSGENSTRKPLFKVESMSDYTAVSRNAYISLKKEAIHDLAWRISAIERNTK